VAEIGRRWTVNRSENIALMIERFTELLRAFPMDGIAVRSDIAYGEHSRQQLDISAPEDDRKERAAVVFIHGGAFMDGHRNRTDRIYSNVPLYCARNGVVGSPSAIVLVAM
jgi:acetyl esterase/lipase